MSEGRREISLIWEEIPETLSQCCKHLALKSISDAVLSQQPSPKILLQKFLSLILTNLDQIHRDIVKKHDEKFCKKFLGLGCCDKTTSENDFSTILQQWKLKWRGN